MQWEHRVHGVWEMSGAGNAAHLLEIWRTSVEMGETVADYKTPYYVVPESHI